MSLSADEIDDIGEDFLNHICSINKINKTSPHKDRYGWDKYIEFISDGNKFSSLIQLKTSIKRKTKYPSASIKLSNWKLMAEEVLPFFVVFLQISNRGEKINAFLVHIDKKWIIKSNKYIKLATIKGKLLNRTTLSLKPSDKDIIKIDGSDFLQKLVFHIGSSLANYISSKDEWNKSKNYSFFSKGTRFKTDHSTEEVAQFFLGYDIPISFSEINIFDDDLKKIIRSYQDIPGSSLEYLPNTIPVAIDLLIEKKEVDSFMGQMFSVSMIENQTKIHKLRISCDLGEFLIEGAMFKYIPQLTIHGRAPLILNARIAKIILAIIEEKEIIFRFRNKNKSDMMIPVSFTDIKPFPNAIKMCNYLIMMKEIEDDYKIDSNHPFDPDGYANKEDYQSIKNLYIFIKAQYNEIKNFNVSIDSDVTLGEKIIIPYHFKYRLGPYSVYLGVCLIGEVVSKNVVSGYLEIIEKYKKFEESSNLESEYSNFISKLQSKYSKILNNTRIIDY